MSDCFRKNNQHFHEDTLSFTLIPFFAFTNPLLLHLQFDSATLPALFGQPQTLQ